MIFNFATEPSNRMNLIAFAQMGNRLGGATILIVSGLIT